MKIEMTESPLFAVVASYRYAPKGGLSAPEVLRNIFNSENEDT